MYVVPGTSLHTHTRIRVSHVESSLRECEFRVIRDGCRSDEEKSNPLYKLHQFPSLNWRRLDRLEGQSFPNEENTASLSDFAKVARREKCADICSISMIKTMIKTMLNTDLIIVGILYSIMANDNVLSVRWFILLLNFISRNWYFSNYITNIVYNKYVESGSIDTVLLLDRMLNNSYNIDTLLKRARERACT